MRNEQFLYFARAENYIAHSWKDCQKRGVVKDEDDEEGGKAQSSSRSSLSSLE